jgi:hypothetical protein
MISVTCFPLLGWEVLEISRLSMATYILNTCTHPFVIIVSKVSEEGSSGSEGVKREHTVLTLTKKW